MDYIEVVFGSDPKEQTRLARQVWSGTKTATSAVKCIYDARHSCPPAPGERWRIRDGWGLEICRVRVTAVSVILWRDVDEQFAADEGDGTLENWRRIHEPYYASLLAREGQALGPLTELYAIYFSPLPPPVCLSYLSPPGHRLQ